MSKSCFFIQGERGAGKSYLLRQAFLPYAHVLAGFTVQRLYRGGQLCGFRACLLDGDIPPQDAHLPADAAHDDIPPDAFMYMGARRPELLEQTIQAVAAQCTHGGKRLVLLDEIGGFELKPRVFMSALDAVLDSGLPVAGVFKSLGNLKDTIQHTNMDDSYMELHSRLRKRIEAEGELLTLTEQNRPDIAKYISVFIETNI